MNKGNFYGTKYLLNIYKVLTHKTKKRGTIMGIDEVKGAGLQKQNYTSVKVKDKDSGKSFVINFTNSKVKGNKAEWTIKDGKVYDKDGKTLKENEIEVTRYQAALIKAAAEGDGNGQYLDSNDLIGAGFAENADKELQNVKSEYHVAKDDYNNPAPFGDADALEHGIIYANVENAQGERGHLDIKFLDENK